MTEKRYTVIHLGNPVDCVIKDHASNNTIGVFSSMHNPVNEVCDLLNSKEETIIEQSIQLDYLQDENQHMKDVLNENKQLTEQIKELKKENEGIQNKVWYLIACLELKHGIDKKEIKEYWNKGCDV